MPGVSKSRVPLAVRRDCKQYSTTIGLEKETEDKITGAPCVMIEDGSLGIAHPKSSQWDLSPASRIRILQKESLVSDNEEARL